MHYIYIILPRMYGFVIYNMKVELSTINQIKSSITRIRVKVMVLNATFNYVSVITWWSDLLMEGTAVPGENLRSVTSN